MLSAQASAALRRRRRGAAVGDAGPGRRAGRGCVRTAARCAARRRRRRSSRRQPTRSARFEAALRALDDAEGLRLARAELHLALAGLLHEQAVDRPDLLNRAVPHYHSALQLVLREEAPLLWASAHANLATAYLTMPMTEASGQLRLGVAAQSLRSALKVYTPEDYPEQWASVQLNLANSLVYTPSSHQADNLVEAVDLYEAVLAGPRPRHRPDGPGAGAGQPGQRAGPPRRLRPGQGQAVRGALPVRGTRRSRRRCARCAVCSTRSPVSRRSTAPSRMRSR